MVNWNIYIYIYCGIHIYVYVFTETLHDHIFPIHVNKYYLHRNCQIDAKEIIYLSYLPIVLR